MITGVGIVRGGMPFTEVRERARAQMPAVSRVHPRAVPRVMRSREVDERTRFGHPLNLAQQVRNRLYVLDDVRGVNRLETTVAEGQGGVINVRHDVDAGDREEINADGARCLVAPASHIEYAC